MVAIPKLSWTMSLAVGPTQLLFDHISALIAFTYNSFKEPAKFSTR
jgi:hypothetical protein